MNYQAVGATLLPIIINIPSSIITRKSIKNWYQVMFDKMILIKICNIFYFYMTDE